MSGWTDDELDRIGAADELEIASYRPDGSLRRYTTIWVVRVGDDLYVRSWHGRAASWFRWALQRHQGRIEAGGLNAMSPSRSLTTTCIRQSIRHTAPNTAATQIPMSSRWLSRRLLQPHFA